MNRTKLSFTILALMGVSGCVAPRMSVDELKARLPARPSELDRLNMLVGAWDTAGTVKLIGMDDPIETTGRSVARWSADGWLLIDESEYDMGSLGRMSGVSLWTWDDRAKVYRVYWFDSFGERASGTARFDEATRTWRMKTSGRSAVCSVMSQGEIQLLDDGRLAWTYDQWDGWGFMKFAEMRGTSTRR